MKKIYALVLSLIVFSAGFSQRLLTWTPEFPADNSALTVVVDAAKGNMGLNNYEGGASQNVYVHVGVITNLSSGPTDWRYAPFAWGTANAAAKATPLGNNKYQFTIPNIRQFFGVPAGETIRYVTIIFRSANGNLKAVNSDGSDMYIPVTPAGTLAARLTLPPKEPRYVPWTEPINIPVGTALPIQGQSSVAANLTLKLDGVVVGTANNATTISANPVINATCDHQIILEATSGGNTVRDTINFFIPGATTVQALPAGVKDGINYNSNSSVTLVLYAPYKNHAVVKGDFNNWVPGCASMMNKTPDGNRFWVTLNNLTPGRIYGFQYVVDDTITTTDPYTELVLDPWNDQYIPASTYPNMPAYPTGLTTGFVGTFQTAAPQYTWSNSSYTRPDKKQLVIYELLMRDFLSAHNWQTAIDSLNYLKNLGINAIELMPINEFDGNNSWGYNPAFFFAPDKAYGTKNQLKRFIDSAHSKGMAVIVDAVFNHVTGASPLAQLYWNSATNKPAANNPWLNVDAKHPFSVFNDFNHEAEITKYHVARYIRFWLTEYKIDGFRWDLSKGFTQVQTNDVGAWNQFDQSRINIWQRYMDSSQVVSNGSYMILEHLGNDDEESNLANRGFLLWGNMNTQYNQNTMGFATNSDINRAYFGNRSGWSQPHLVTYAESHDEERIMYRNLSFGNNSQATHNVRQLSVALKRTEGMQPFLLLLPGPKMIWQFGELGYDKSIFTCENGTVPTPYGNDQCKTNPKPILWNYNADPARKSIYNVIAKLNWLRKQKPMAFVNGSIGGYLGSDLKKVLTLNHTDLKLAAVTNFDVVQQTITVTFPSAGTYYELFDGSTFTATGSAQTVTLPAGAYKVWTNMPPCNTAAPTTANTTITYCQNQTATALTATGTGLLWYTSASGGTGSTTAPVPNTSVVGSTTYYVSQTVGCESPRLAITVNVTASLAAPTVTGTVSYCQGATATPLTATGQNLKWYTSATGGTSSTTAPTPSTTTPGTTTYYVSQSSGTCESPRASITVSVTAAPSAPTVTSPVAYCQGASATALTATGTGLLWYTSATGGTGSATAPTPVTTATGSTTYYVSQSTGNCEGPRAAIVVNVTAVPNAPAVNSPVTYCQGQAATALTATGSNLKWYTSSTGGTGSTTAPTPSTATVGSTSYYVSQTVGTCESPRAEIVVNIVTATPAPTVTSPVTYCQGATATALTASGNGLKWYTTATGGTGSTTAPVPSTATAGSTTYYVSQTTSCGEGPRAAIVVNITAAPAAPTVTSPVAYCQGATATALTATGTGLLWYTSATGGTGSATAPTPVTTATGSTTYYVSQSTGSCEGPRAAIVVNVTAVPNAPAVSSPVTYCQGQAATALTATGSNLKWYTAATGGTGSTTAPTPSTATVGSTSYYVSQTVGTCESPRAEIVVNIVTATPAPTVTTPVTYCQGATATALTASGSGLLWYMSATGGTGSATAPTPSTTAVGSTSYFVSQTTSCGEGPRAEIVVNIVATPSAPGTTNLTYCQGETASPLTATGTGLVWYTTATGGTGTTTAPTPSTTATGTTTYYVAQSAGSCEGPRAALTVTVNATPAAPTVTTPIEYCQGATATPLTATGTNLLWYTAATGGTGSATAPTPSTVSAGTTTYYVAQTSGNCESPRAAIVVNINAQPDAPTATTTIEYCLNATASPLTATGNGLLWYTTATGGTGSATAPTPTTTTEGSTTWYVSQSNNCGEGPRTAITVNVVNGPAAPTGLSASAITMNTATLSWVGSTGAFYKVEYAVAGSGTWMQAGAVTTETSVQLSGLTQNTGYDWRVTAMCSANATSGNMSAVATFTTTSHNSQIPNIKDGIGIKISPNPVHNYAILDYIVPGNGKVAIGVFNAQGRLVVKLHEQLQTAGQYSLNVTGKMLKLANGVYYIRIEQNNKSNYVTFLKD